MRSAYLTLVFFTGLSSVACSGTVDTHASSDSTGAGGGSTTSSATATGAGGATSAASSATGSTAASSSNAGSTTGAGASTSSTGAGGGPGCSGYVDLVEDSGAPKHFASSCAGFGTGTANGNLFSGGPVGSPAGTLIHGCASLAANSPGINLSIQGAMGPGTFTTGLPSYTDAGGSHWGFLGDSMTVAITKLEGQGGVIEGSFTAFVTHVQGGNAARTLTGTFHVCHTMDLFAP